MEKINGWSLPLNALGLIGSVFGLAISIDNGFLFSAIGFRILFWAFAIVFVWKECIKW